MLRQVFLLLALFLCLSFVQADYGVTVKSPDFSCEVQISLGSPQWAFYQNDNASWVYRVTFVGLWEIENGTEFDLVENSYVEPKNGWMISMAALGNNSQQVSVMTDDHSNPHMQNIAMTTHVPMGAVNGSDYAAGKFDVEITNYEWQSMSADAQLVLAFSLDYEVNSKTTSMANLTTHGSRTVDFSGAYFSINSTAMGGPKLNTSISVTVKMAGDVNASHVPSFYSHNAYVIYDHFQTNLKHDPEFGFGEGPGNSYIWIIIIVVVVIAIIVIILIAIIGFILVRRRRRSYDAF